ncbi:hypothetical protein PMAYCL1PPCAC_01281 [Pristionchus mayeri]|uniref:Uncharacterized protein n=1 Tax=Pristionchus mayeri TaxID=1317129 RepID=A0AAN5C793_9BILA|nr:hypothetical protein PMAYCL1PPCAC_01281 [Pristionchus mayeri]
MTSDNDSSKIVIPGDVLFPSSETRRPGKGTYELHGSIYSSLAGFVFVKEEKQRDRTIEIVEVRRSEIGHDHVVPYIGGVVTARVSSIGQRFAKCTLLCVESTPLPGGAEFGAMLRREDIRATDKDKIDLPRCVSPGDIILARVISFGDNQTSFLLSMAEDELGVVSGVSESGERMLPVDWEHMAGVKSGVRERRKVARVPKMNQLLG